MHTELHATSRLAHLIACGGRMRGRPPDFVLYVHVDALAQRGFHAAQIAAVGVRPDIARLLRVLVPLLHYWLRLSAAVVCLGGGYLLLLIDLCRGCVL